MAILPSLIEEVSPVHMGAGKCSDKHGHNLAQAVAASTNQNVEAI